MTDNFEDHENMVSTYRNHADRRRRLLKAEPVRRKPQIPDRPAEDFDCYAAAAERGARTAFGMVDDSRFGPFNVVRPNPVGLVLCAASALSFGLVAAIVALWLLAPGWLWTAPPHIALDNSSWCFGFDHGLSCTQHKAGKDDRSHR